MTFFWKCKNYFFSPYNSIFVAASDAEMTHFSYKELVREHIPEEQANLSFPLKHEHSGGGQT